MATAGSQEEENVLQVEHWAHDDKTFCQRSGMFGKEGDDESGK